MTATVNRRRPLRALFLASLGPVPARAIDAWLEDGHAVAEIWTAGRLQRGRWRRNRQLGWFAPSWSLASVISRWRIPHRRIESVKADPEAVAARMMALNVDVIVSVHFSLILPAALLSRLSVPVLNLHPALLPAYRGPSPMLGMLLDEQQDVAGGVTLHAIEPGIDTGAIFAARPVPWPASRNPRAWELAIACAAADLAVAAIPRVVAGEMAGVPQDEGAASYRRPAHQELTILPSHTLARVTWLMAAIAPLMSLTVAMNGRGYAVTALVRHLGEPSGQPSRIGWRSIDLDIADARVRLRRRAWWEGRRRRLATWWLKVRTR